MPNDKNVQTEFGLDKISMLIKNEAPKLIGRLEERYICYEEQSPTNLLEEFQNLTQTEKFKFLGWIISAIRQMRLELNFFNALKYINLSTAMKLEMMTDKELKKATFEEEEAFEDGYNAALLKKDK